MALKNASEQSGSGGQRGLQNFVGLVSQIPGVGGGFADQARTLQAQSEAQQQENDKMRASAAQNAVAGFQGHGIPGLSPNLDPVKVAEKIYPIMVSVPTTTLLPYTNQTFVMKEFRDRIGIFPGPVIGFIVCFNPS